MGGLLKRVVPAVVVLLVVIQVFRPSRTNPTADPKNEMTASLAGLQKSRPSSTGPAAIATRTARSGRGTAGWRQCHGWSLTT